MFMPRVYLLFYKNYVFSNSLNLHLFHTSHFGWQLVCDRPLNLLQKSLKLVFYALQSL